LGEDPLEQVDAREPPGAILAQQRSRSLTVVARVKSAPSALAGGGENGGRASGAAVRKVGRDEVPDVDGALTALAGVADEAGEVEQDLGHLLPGMGHGADDIAAGNEPGGHVAGGRVGIAKRQQGVFECCISSFVASPKEPESAGVGREEEPGQGLHLPGDWHRRCEGLCGLSHPLEAIDVGASLGLEQQVAR